MISLRFVQKAYPFLLVLALLGGLAALMYSPYLLTHPFLSTGITVDLLLVVPLVYFLSIRRSAIPKTSVVMVVVAGTVLGSLLLPGGHQGLLSTFKRYALPVLELGILAYVIIKIRSGVVNYRQLGQVSPDFFHGVKEALRSILPPVLVVPMATELAVFYYGFLSWKVKAYHSCEFTYHRRSGSLAVYGVFLMLILVEAFVLHLVIELWSPVAAWVLTLLSAYTFLQVFGFVRSMPKRPIRVGEYLQLRYGICNEAVISYEAIQSIEVSGREPSGAVSFSPLGVMESHNVILTLKEEQPLNGLYGMKKQFRILKLFVDDPEAFAEAVGQAAQLKRG